MSTANLYTFINRAMDRHTKYVDRTRLTNSPVLYLYAEDPGAVFDADWFFVATNLKYEHYRQKNDEHKFPQKPPHFSLGLDIACFAKERWADASSLKQRTAETLRTFTNLQRDAFELLIAGHTQKKIADTLGKSQSWASRNANIIRQRFGMTQKKKEISQN